MNAKMIIWR